MYLDVLVEYNVDKTFEYKINEKIEKYSRVLVPFNNRYLEGIVLNIKKKSFFDRDKVLNVKKVLDYEAILNDELYNIALLMSKYYFASLINCLMVMLPPSLKIKSKRKETNTKTNKLYTLLHEEKIRGNKQIEVINLLKKGPKRRDETPVSISILNNLRDKGNIKEEIIDIPRINIITKNNEYVLNEEQKKSRDNIINSKKLVNLLYGVTGSGKTYVYLDLIKKTLSNNKKVIMLLPEISLTTQTIDFFKNYLQCRMAIFHSGLSISEKHEEYLKIKNDEVDLVIGARSAIFAPLNNIGLIIIDEEHTSSYKQDKGLLYNVFDIAQMRAKFHNLKIVLGSATPSLYTYANALKDNYNLVKINYRPEGSFLPNIKIIDLKKEKGIFSKYLVTSIRERLARDEQILIMLNRRGYASFSECQNCGEVIKCPACDISLTYHLDSNELKCHYCDYKVRYIKKCPKCGENGLSVKGIGTEKIVEELNKLFDVKILRMDYDTTRRKGSYEKIINAFKNKEANILVGTQMISKGLNFEDVTLSAVINADTGLNIPSFSSSEDTFSLLLQTSGRAGRGKKRGEVIIQTYNPDHYVYECLKNHSYDDFFRKEMTIRRTLKYPPYFYMIELRIVHKNEQKVIEEITKISRYLKDNLKNSIILGPSPSGILKINHNYRYSIYIKYQYEESLEKVLAFIYKNYVDKNINLIINRNPLGI